MIVVKVELWSAITGSVTELARMEIANDGTGTLAQRNYIARTLRGRSAEAFRSRTTQRHTALKNWPSEALHIWNLVTAVLRQMSYGQHVREPGEDLFEIKPEHESGSPG